MVCEATDHGTALAKLCDDEALDKEQFKAFISTYIFNDQKPLRDKVLKCLGDQPSILQARELENASFRR